MKPPPKRPRRLFQPSRLRVARMAAGMTRAKLHEATGFTMAAIADYERGFEHPDANQLRKLAEALGVSVRWFYRPHLECPEASAITIPRDLSGMAIDQVRAVCAIGMDLAAALGQQRRERADNTFENLVESVRFCEPTDAAYVVRAQLPTVGGRRIRSVVHACEILNVLVLSIPPHLLGGPTDSVSSWSCWVSGQSPVIFVDTSRGDLATREALAAELGILLTYRLPVEGEIEWGRTAEIADHFAPNFLAPVPDVLGEKGLNARSISAANIRKVAARWGVSPLTLAQQIRGAVRWEQHGIDHSRHGYVRLDKAELELQAAHAAVVRAELDGHKGLAATLDPLEDIEEVSKLLDRAARNGWPISRIADGMGLPTSVLRDLTRGLVLGEVVTMTELRQAANRRRRGY